MDSLSALISTFSLRFLIVLFVYVSSMRTQGALRVRPHAHGSDRESPIAYVLVDGFYSDVAVDAVCSEVARDAQGDGFEPRQNLKIVDVTRTDGACSLVQNSITVHLTTECLSNDTSQLTAPVVSIPPHYRGGSRSLASHVSFSHTDSLELPVVVAIASKLEWKSAVYVGSEDNNAFVQRLLRCSRTFEIIDMVILKEETDTEIDYQTIQNSNADFVLVHCQSYSCYQLVAKLFYLRNENAEGSSAPWLLTEILTKSTRPGTSPGPMMLQSTTLGLQKALPNSPRSDILLEDIPSLDASQSQCYLLQHCPTTIKQQLQVLDFYDSLVAVSHLLQHEKQYSAQRQQPLYQLLNNANLQGISGTIRFESAFERSYSTLYDVLDISPFVVATIGVYDSSSSHWLHALKPLRSEVKKPGRYRRQQKRCEPANGVFRVTTMIEPPFIIHDPNNTEAPGEAHSGPYAGMVVDMMEAISKDMGFEYEMYEPPDLLYGSVHENGSSDGMVRELVTCEAHVAAAAFAITATRSKYIHFTKPYIDAGKTLLAYKGEATSSDLWAFLNPFDFATKLVIVCCFLAVSIVYIILGKISPYRQSLESEARGNGQSLGLQTEGNSQSLELQTRGNSQPLESQTRRRSRRSGEVGANSALWFFYTTAMQQGPDHIPSISGKIIVAGWFFFCLVIIATYTANLAAFLTVKSFAEGIHSLDDLAKQTEVIYGTVKSTSITEFFKNSPVEVHQRMYAFMTSTDDALVETAAEAYERVQYQTKGPYVFIWDEPILDYVASRSPCRSQVVGRAFNSQGYGLALPLNMPYQLNFSLAILKLRESGLIDGLRDKWLRAGDCDTTTNAKELTDAEEVRLSDLLGVFIILGSAVGLSVIIAFVECWWWRRRTQASVNISHVNGDVNTYSTPNAAHRDSDQLSNDG